MSVLALAALAVAGGCNGGSEKEAAVWPKEPAASAVQASGGRGQAPPEPSERTQEGEGKMLSKQARTRLLELARRSVEAAVRGEPLAPVEVQDLSLIHI